MAELVKKALIDQGLSMGMNESWFADMAKQGFVLQGINKRYATFEKGAPQNLKYRIDILKDRLTQGQIDMYTEAGWEFVGNNTSMFYVFSSPAQRITKEIAIDETLRNNTLEALNKRVKMNTVAIVLCVITEILIIAGMWLIRSPYYRMINSKVYYELSITILMGICLFSSIKSSNNLNKLKKSLEQGTPTDYNQDWQKQRKNDRIQTAFIFSVAIFSISFSIYQNNKYGMTMLSDLQEPLPVIRLEQIEENPKYEVLHMINERSKNEDWGNRVTTDWGFFVPVQLSVEENAIVRETPNVSEKDAYTPSLYTYYYEVRYQGMVDDFLGDIMEQFNYDPNVIITKTSSEVLDNLYVAKGDFSVNIYASKGKEIHYIRYYGEKDAERVIKLLEDSYR